MDKRAAKDATLLSLIFLGGLLGLIGWVVLTVMAMGAFGVWMIAPMLGAPGVALFWLLMYDACKRGKD